MQLKNEIIDSDILYRMYSSKNHYEREGHHPNKKSEVIIQYI